MTITLPFQSPAGRHTASPTSPSRGRPDHTPASRHVGHTHGHNGTGGEREAGPSDPAETVILPGTAVQAAAAAWRFAEHAIDIAEKANDRAERADTHTGYAIAIAVVSLAVAAWTAVATWIG